ncbi:MAG: GAF domain-containing protein [Gemmatimonadetes bacterium]|nr:GAF domain-containing protein [Gemmatimonadota bacterium]
MGGEIVGRVWSFRDVTARTRAEEALRREHGFVRLLQAVAVAANEARTVEDAFLHCLDRICNHTGWPVGHVYLAGEDLSGDLVPTKLWHLDDPVRHEVFRRMTEATRLPPGVGLPGRVLATHKPEWVIDVRSDPNFPRARVARDIGLRAGFAFPVMVGTEVAAVLEFFAPEPTPPDEALLDVMSHVGTQLGRVIERRRAGARTSRG